MTQEPTDKELRTDFGENLHRFFVISRRISVQLDDKIKVLQSRVENGQAYSLNKCLAAKSEIDDMILELSDLAESLGFDENEQSKGPQDTIELDRVGELVILLGSSIYDLADYHFETLHSLGNDFQDLSKCRNLIYKTWEQIKVRM